MQRCGFGQLMKLRRAGFESDAVTSQRRHIFQQILETLRGKPFRVTSVKSRLEIILWVVKFRAADLCFCAFDRWLWVFGESPAGR